MSPRYFLKKILHEYYYKTNPMHTALEQNDAGFAGYLIKNYPDSFATAPADAKALSLVRKASEDGDWSMFDMMFKHGMKLPISEKYAVTETTSTSYYSSKKTWTKLHDSTQLEILYASDPENFMTMIDAMNQYKTELPASSKMESKHAELFFQQTALLHILTHHLQERHTCIHSKNVLEGMFKVQSSLKNAPKEFLALSGVVSLIGDAKVAAQTTIEKLESLQPDTKVTMPEWIDLKALGVIHDIETPSDHTPPELQPEHGISQWDVSVKNEL